jgi:hypothetical protein
MRPVCYIPPRLATRAVPEAVARFRSSYHVPDDHEPIGAVAIGYDAEAEKRGLRSKRRNVEDLVHYGRRQG